MRTTRCRSMSTASSRPPVVKRRKPKPRVRREGPWLIVIYPDGTEVYFTAESEKHLAVETEDDRVL